MTLGELIELGLTASRVRRRQNQLFHFDRRRLMGHGLTIEQIDRAEVAVARIEQFTADEIATAIGETTFLTDGKTK